MQHLLLLHGALGAASDFGLIATQLEKKFVVQTMNFQGHGGRPFEHDFSIASFANEVLAFTDSIQWKRFNVFGYSMGGYIGMWLALNRPDSIDRLMTLGTKFVWSPEIATSAIKEMNPDIIQEKVPAFATMLAQKHGAAQWKTLLKDTSQLLLQMGSNNPFSIASLSSIKIPVSILSGEKDLMVSPSESMTVAQTIPLAKYIMLAGTQHPIQKVPLELLVPVIEKFFMPE